MYILQRSLRSRDTNMGLPLPTNIIMNDFVHNFQRVSIFPQSSRQFLSNITSLEWYGNQTSKLFETLSFSPKLTGMNIIVDTVPVLVNQYPRTSPEGSLPMTLQHLSCKYTGIHRFNSGTSVGMTALASALQSLGACENLKSLNIETEVIMEVGPFTVISSALKLLKNIETLEVPFYWQPSLENVPNPLVHFIFYFQQ